MKYIIALTALFLNASAQQAYHYCGFENGIEYHENAFPGYKNHLASSFEQAKIKGEELALFRSTNQTLTIPVVVHVVWKDALQNIPDQQIIDVIASINKDYSRTNPDTTSLRPVFQPVAGNPNIQFNLVQIVRTQTTQTFALDFLTGLPDKVKQTANGGSDAWNTADYLNIWVCDIASSPLGELLGYAYPPANLANWPAGTNAPSSELDGVVIDYQAFKSSGTTSFQGMTINTRARTVTHEVGHYLGLRHTSGDGQSNPFNPQPACSTDDGISDTPLQNIQSQFDCNSNQNTCGAGTLGDLPDMIENYLDYSSETCMNSFTQVQVNLMRGVLANQRAQLVDGVYTGIHELDLSPKIGFSNNDNNTISIYFNAEKNYSISIKNLLGQTILSEMNIASNNIVSNFNVSNIENGVYLIELTSGNKTGVKKIVLLK